MRSPQLSFWNGAHIFLFFLNDGKRHIRSTLVSIRLYVYLGAFLGLLVALSFFQCPEDISNISSICKMLTIFTWVACLFGAGFRRKLVPYILGRRSATQTAPSFCCGRPDSSVLAEGRGCILHVEGSWIVGTKRCPQPDCIFQTLPPQQVLTHVLFSQCDLDILPMVGGSLPPSRESGRDIDCFASIVSRIDSLWHPRLNNATHTCLGKLVLRTQPGCCQEAQTSPCGQMLWKATYRWFYPLALGYPVASSLPSGRSRHHGEKTSQPRFSVQTPDSQTLWT